MMRSRFSDREPQSHPSSRDRSPIHRGHERSAAIANDTSDPDRINSRIFVGRLIPEITRYMLQDHFSKWGDVIGATVTNSNFGFIQFRNESEAQACLASGSVTTINGVSLDVKPAKLGPTATQSAAPYPAPGLGGRDVIPSGPERRGGWEGDLPSKFSDRREYDQGHDSRFPFREEFKGRDDSRIAGSYDDRFRSREYYRGNESGGNGYYGSQEPSYNNRNTYDSPIYDKPKLDPLHPERPNDIEIVVPNKMQRAFAESIETRLKRFDLTVDLLFPPTDISPERVLKDLSARQCLYAIFATTENEKHNSLTLNILHGEPQEHRNMPVEDAMRLIQQNFEDYIKKTRLRNMREVVPRDVRSLLLDLLEMRPLSMGDLDKIIKYLRERQNALVDDQIEQKRETAGQTQQSSMLAITYPGLQNYVHPVAGAGTAIRATGAQGSLNLASAPNVQGAYSATAYSGLQGLPPSAAATIRTNATALKGFGVPQQSPSQSANSQYNVLSGNASVTPSQVGKPSEQELQERILNLMKNSQGLGAAPTLHAPTGVPAPSGVPPPVPVAQSMQQQQPWMSRQQQSRGNASQGNQGNQAYNPWSM